GSTRANPNIDRLDEIELPLRCFEMIASLLGEILAIPSMTGPTKDEGSRYVAQKIASLTAFAKRLEVDEKCFSPISQLSDLAFRDEAPSLESRFDSAFDSWFRASAFYFGGIGQRFSPLSNLVFDLG